LFVCIQQHALIVGSGCCSEPLVQDGARASR